MKSRHGKFTTTLDQSTPGPVAGFGWETVDWKMEVDVEYVYTPGSPATRMDQETPAEVEITRIAGDGGYGEVEIDFDTLRERVQDNLREQAMLDAEESANAIQAQAEDAYEAKRRGE